MIVRKEDPKAHGRAPLRLAALVLSLLMPLVALSAAPAAARPLVLTGPADGAALAPRIDYALDPDRSLKLADFLGAPSVEMHALETAAPDFGYTPALIWLRIELVNAAEADDWRLHLHGNFWPEAQVRLIRADGTVDTALDLRPDSPFSARPVVHPQVVAPFRLAPGEAATLILAYSSQGSSRLSLSLETAESFVRRAQAEQAKNHVFYGMILVLVVIALIAVAVFRQRLFVVYAGYILSLLLYIAHADGAAFQHLWPDRPGFNGMASVVFGAGAMVFGGLFAMIFLETRRHHPAMHALLLAIVIGAPALDLVLWATDPQLLKKLLVMMVAVSALIYLSAALLAARTRFREVRFYLFAWAACLIPASLFTARNVLGLQIAEVSLYDAIRAGLFFDACMMGFAAFDQLRRSREQAMAESLAAARRSLALGERLALLEGRYEIAVEQAKRREESVKDAAHDLRQPMHALRLSLRRRLAGGASGEADAANIETALGYMERLVADRLAERPAPAPAAPAAAEPGLHEVLRNVAEMFGPEAEAKGLGLRLRLGAPDAPVAAYPLMRALANLVSNAIKYTREGRILLSLRRAGDGLRVEVHDTGPGLAGAAFAEALARGARLARDRDAAEGGGAGLAIVTEIAAAEGWRLSACPRRRRGASLRLHLPRSAAAAPQG